MSTSDKADGHESATRDGIGSPKDSTARSNRRCPLRPLENNLNSHQSSGANGGDRRKSQSATSNNRDGNVAPMEFDRTSDQKKREGSPIH